MSLSAEAAIAAKPYNQAMHWPAHHAGPRSQSLPRLELEVDASRSPGCCSAGVPVLTAACEPRQRVR
jgi:hypothetical protein